MVRGPLSLYALQKLVGEEYLKLFTSLYGLETVSIRYFNAFGPCQDPDSRSSGVISLFVTLQWIIGCSLSPEYLPKRVGDFRDSQADIGKAKTILGYVPLVSFEEGLRRTVDWYRSVLR